MHGVGEMTWPSGDKYIGDWDQDNRQGFGLYLYASGNRYKGSYVGNKKEGYGQFWWTTGRNAGRDEMSFFEMLINEGWHRSKPNQTIYSSRILINLCSKRPLNYGVFYINMSISLTSSSE